jgi:hypothetical protein
MMDELILAFENMPATVWRKLLPIQAENDALGLDRAKSQALAKLFLTVGEKCPFRQTLTSLFPCLLRIIVSLQT